MLAVLRLLLYLGEFAIGAFGVWSLLPDKTKTQLSSWVHNWLLAAITIAPALLADAEPYVLPILAAFRDAFVKYGPGYSTAISGPLGDLAKSEFTATEALLTTAGLSTPDNAVDTAAEAIRAAFGFGMSSAAVTAAFEAVFPEKLNTLNGVGPMFSKMAGFDEVVEQIRDPLYANAFGKSAEYHYRSIFKPEYPDEGDAVTWHSRRLLTDDQLREIFAISGLKQQYEAPYVASAYRAIQPRALATLLIDSPFPTAEVQSALEFAGLRPQDVAFMLPALEYNSTRNVRQQYLSAAVRSTELGTMTPAELTGVLERSQLFAGRAVVGPADGRHAEARATRGTLPKVHQRGLQDRPDNRRSIRAFARSDRHRSR